MGIFTSEKQSTQVAWNRHGVGLKSIFDRENNEKQGLQIHDVRISCPLG